LITIEIPVVTEHPFPTDYVLTDKRSKVKPKQTNRPANPNRRPQTGRNTNSADSKPTFTPKQSENGAKKTESAPKKFWGR